MALTADQIAEIREWVGTAPEDADLDTIYTRVGTINETALSVLKSRRTTLRETLAGQPNKIGLDGDYSHEWGPVRTVYDEDIERLEQLVASESGSDPSLPVLTIAGSVGRSDRDGLFGS